MVNGGMDSGVNPLALNPNCTIYYLYGLKQDKCLLYASLFPSTNWGRGDKNTVGLLRLSEELSMLMNVKHFVTGVSGPE